MGGDAKMPKNLKGDRLKNPTIEMRLSNNAKTPKALEAAPLKNTVIEGHVIEDEKRPTNLKSNALPTEGYALEVDGKMKSHYDSAETASKAGLALKTKFPHVQVNVYDVKERARTLVKLSD